MFNIVHVANISNVGYHLGYLTSYTLSNPTYLKSSPTFKFVQFQNSHFLAGWGTTSFGGPTSKVLMETTLKVRPISECQAAFAEVTEKQLCTYGKNTDACQVGTELNAI